MAANGMTGRKRVLKMYRPTVLPTPDGEQMVRLLLRIQAAADL